MAKIGCGMNCDMSYDESMAGAQMEGFRGIDGGDGVWHDYEHLYEVPKHRACLDGGCQLRKAIQQHYH